MSEIKPNASVTKDPFAAKAPFQIDATLPGDAEFPEGYVLRWKNPKILNDGTTGGWRGWRPIEWDSPLAADIHKYIPDAPMRMQGSDKVDNVIRRADTILCYLPKAWYDARQNASANESRQRVADLSVPEGQEIMPNVVTFGGGRKADKNPTFGNDKPLNSELAAKLRNNK